MTWKDVNCMIDITTFPAGTRVYIKSNWVDRFNTGSVVSPSCFLKEDLPLSLGTDFGWGYTLSDFTLVLWDDVDVPVLALVIALDKI